MDPAYREQARLRHQQHLQRTQASAALPRPEQPVSAVATSPLRPCPSVPSTADLDLALARKLQLEEDVVAAQASRQRAERMALEAADAAAAAQLQRDWDQAAVSDAEAEAFAQRLQAEEMEQGVDRDHVPVPRGYEAFGEAFPHVQVMRHVFEQHPFPLEPPFPPPPPPHGPPSLAYQQHLRMMQEQQARLLGLAPDHLAPHHALHPPPHQHRHDDGTVLYDAAVPEHHLDLHHRLHQQQVAALEQRQARWHDMQQQQHAAIRHQLEHVRAVLGGGAAAQHLHGGGGDGGGRHPLGQLFGINLAHHGHHDDLEDGDDDDLDAVAPDPRAAIDALPTHAYQRRTGTAASAENTSCVVCMADFADGEQVRTLPCFHQFHTPCIDEWLARTPKCPVCRGSILPT